MRPLEKLITGIVLIIVFIGAVLFFSVMSFTIGDDFKEVVKFTAVLLGGVAIFAYITEKGKK